MRLIISTSVALVLVGLYYAYGSYLGFTRSVEMCQHYHCGFVPTFPTSTVLLGIGFILFGLALFLFRKKITDVEFLDYKKEAKGIISVALVFVASWVHILVTKPCSNRMEFFPCDFSIGFPVGFFMVTDYLDWTLIIRFFVGMFFDYTFWFLVLSIIFKLAKRTKKL